MLPKNNLAWTLKNNKKLNSENKKLFKKYLTLTSCEKKSGIKWFVKRTQL